MPLLSPAKEAGTLAAQSIMTTDTVSKEVAGEPDAGRKDSDYWGNV